jgi:hypothetical protein
MMGRLGGVVLLKEGLVRKCKKAGGRGYFFMVLLEGRSWLQLGDVVLNGFMVGQKSD